MTKNERQLLPSITRDDVWINGYCGGYFEQKPTDIVRRRCRHSAKAWETYERGFMAGTRSWRKHNA